MTKVSTIVLLLASVTMLASCDDDKKKAQQNAAQNAAVASAEQGKIYKDLDSCIADAQDMEHVHACHEAYQQATAKMAEAPRFEQQARCEDVYGPGNCVPRGTYVHDGGGGFVPFMMGYWLGGGFGGRTTVYQPVFVDRSGATYAGATVVNHPSWSGGAPPPPPAARAASAPNPAPSATAPSPVKRGGFGSKATTTSRSSRAGS